MSDGLNSGMVLAAGFGKRMQPLTLTTPKPLIEVAGRTMADRALDRLVEVGVDNVVLNISYLGDQIADHFEARHDVRIDLSREDEPLETGGGVQKALPLLKGDAFFVLNGDAIMLDGPTPALKRMARKWEKDNLDVLLLLQTTATAIGYDGHGDFFLDSDGTPEFKGEETSAPYVFSGVQILSRSVFDGRSAGRWSLREVYEKAIKQGRAKAIVHDGDWLHVGTPQGLKLAEAYFARHA